MPIFENRLANLSHVNASEEKLGCSFVGWRLCQLAVRGACVEGTGFQMSHVYMKWCSHASIASRPMASSSCAVSGVVAEA